MASTGPMHKFEPPKEMLKKAIPQYITKLIVKNNVNYIVLIARSTHT